MALPESKACSITPKRRRPRMRCLRHTGRRFGVFLLPGRSQEAARLLLSGDGQSGRIYGEQGSISEATRGYSSSSTLATRVAQRLLALGEWTRRTMPGFSQSAASSRTSVAARHQPAFAATLGCTLPKRGGLFAR
jgi:hypothetical protein